MKKIFYFILFCIIFYLGFITRQGCNKWFPTYFINNDSIHDTIYTDSIIHDTIIPNIFDISYDSIKNIKIDTIYNIINKDTVNIKYNIRFIYKENDK